MNLEEALSSGKQRFAITGATGWLGRAVLELLSDRLGDQFPRRVAGFASSSRSLTLDSGQTVDIRALDALHGYEHDVLIHLAFVTREHGDALGQDGYVTANAAITARIIETVLRQRPAAIAYASSGAVYKASGDLLGNPYAELKRADELALRGAAKQTDSRLTIARVFNVAGPWLIKPKFAISDLILQARSGGPIGIRANTPVRRSFIDVADLAVMLLDTCLDQSASETIFDTGGEVVELGELAQRVLGALDVRAEIRRDFDPAGPADDYFGDDASCAAVADRIGLIRRDLDEQIRRTASNPLMAVTQ